MNKEPQVPVVPKALKCYCYFLGKRTFVSSTARNLKFCKRLSRILLKVKRNTLLLKKIRNV